MNRFVAMKCSIGTPVVQEKIEKGRAVVNKQGETAKEIVRVDFPDISDLAPLIATGEIEVAGKDGVIHAWSRETNGQLALLNMVKNDQACVVNNFPVFYHDTGKEAVPVTMDNIKEVDLSKVSREVPEKYRPEIGDDYANFDSPSKDKR